MLVALAVLASLWIAALLHLGRSLDWDEIEYFRATRWVGEGQVPYRDFWEHHTPLQWLVFAPLAMLANGPGADAIVVMRWAQVPIWAAVLLLLMRVARGEGLRRWSRWAALVLLLAAPLFAGNAIEYRLDTIGNAAYLGGLLLIAYAGAKNWRWVAAGVLLSAAVLANMRLAPLVVITGAISLFWDATDRRWRPGPRALWMLAGALAAAALFLGWLAATDAWTPFVEGVIRYNVTSNRLAAAEARGALRLPMLLAPFLRGDVAAVALWLASAAGCWIALRELRRPGLLQIAALLLIFSIALVAVSAVQYTYHYQTAYLLMLPLAALAFDRFVTGVPIRRVIVTLIAGVALLINLLPLTSPSFGEPLRYQDRVIREADRRTTAADAVWDGTGYALRRRPAYRYWFLPAGVRLMERKGLIERYDAEELARNPPAAIVYNLRLQFWLDAHPRAGLYVSRNYVPLYRNLWIPGLTARVGPGRGVAWRVPRSGTYEVWASELLLRHPWLARPHEYGRIEGPQAVLLEIPLRQLPPAPYKVRVDGVPMPSGPLHLRKDARVEIFTTGTNPAGILVVPQGVTTLSIAPEERFVF